jgi:alpha,alpha-trehalase
MNEWSLVYEHFDPAGEGLREALCTLGNGYFATRGAAIESQADEIHYPGTYLAGGYNRLKTEIADRVVENEDLVNIPNYLLLIWRPEGGEWFNTAHTDILSYRQELNLRDGLLSREILSRDRQGRETKIVQKRLVSMAEKHIAAMRMTIIPQNWSGRLQCRSAIDGMVINAGVKRYRQLNSRHLESLETARTGVEGLYMICKTRQSHLRIAEAVRTRVLVNGEAQMAERRLVADEGFIADDLGFDVEEGQPVVIEKIAALYSSRDMAVSEAGQEACDAIKHAAGFEDILKSHRVAWKHLWTRFDIVVENETRTQMLLRLHLFHLLQTVSMNSIDGDIGIPARGWHGEAYRGHIFWDEMFIFPIFAISAPELNRSLLLYRYRRLYQARLAANRQGLQGALFPWQSGSNGREETQELHLNPKSGRWNPDHTHLQRHVNAAIAFNVWEYFKTAHDVAFLSSHGVEMMFETARLFASLTSYNDERRRFEIHGVMGPDEYHDGYPGVAEPGLNNNAYTNVMAAWVLQTAARSLDIITTQRRHEIMEMLDLAESEVEHWQSIVSKMYVPFHNGIIISQFEGYERLEEFDWEAYRAKYGDIRRLDRILEAEGISPNRYKLSKQADVLMLFYLFSAEELVDLFTAMGYDFSPDTIPDIINYYLYRTSNGSTLSNVIHSWVLARSDRRRSWAIFREALESDISDIQADTTHEGIHAGAMAGTVDIIRRCYTGLEFRKDEICFNPVMPEELKRLTMAVQYRGNWLDITLTQNFLMVASRQCEAPPVIVCCGDRFHHLDPGRTLALDFTGRTLK